MAHMASKNVVGLLWKPDWDLTRLLNALLWKGSVPLTLNYAANFNNCIVGIKPLKILLPVYPHSTAFKNVVALNYLIINKHTNVE